MTILKLNLLESIDGILQVTARLCHARSPGESPVSYQDGCRYHLLKVPRYSLMRHYAKELLMNEALGRFGPDSGKKKEQTHLPLGSFAKTYLRTADVIATASSHMVLFEAQTQLAAAWLSSRCGAELDNVHDQVCVEGRQQDQIIRELKAAGFQVIAQKI